jgi:hypothetical protein
MKTRFERYCELRNFDNWCLRNPQKANLVAIVAGLVIFGVSQLLQILPPEFLIALIFGAFLFLAFSRGRE